MSDPTLNFYIKRNDLLKPLILTVIDEKTKVAQDLTGVSARFHMRDSNGVVKVDADASVLLPATDGRIQYDWQLGDTDEDGTYDGEIELLVGSKPMTVPNKKHFKVHIFEDIA